MKNITVRFGTQAHTKQFSDDANLGTVVSSSSLKAILGYGDNVRVLIHGVEQDLGSVPPDNTSVTVETRCNSKAVAGK